MVALDVELVDGNIAVGSRVDAIVRHDRLCKGGAKREKEGGGGSEVATAGGAVVVRTRSSQIDC